MEEVDFDFTGRAVFSVKELSEEGEPTGEILECDVPIRGSVGWSKPGPDEYGGFFIVEDTGNPDTERLWPRGCITLSLVGQLHDRRYKGGRLVCVDCEILDRMDKRCVFRASRVRLERRRKLGEGTELPKGPHLTSYLVRKTTERERVSGHRDVWEMLEAKSAEDAWTLAGYNIRCNYQTYSTSKHEGGVQFQASLKCPVVRIEREESTGDFSEDAKLTYRAMDALRMLVGFVERRLFYPWCSRREEVSGGHLNTTTVCGTVGLDRVGRMNLRCVEGKGELFFVENAFERFVEDFDFWSDVFGMYFQAQSTWDYSEKFLAYYLVLEKFVHRHMTANQLEYWVPNEHVEEVKKKVKGALKELIPSGKVPKNYERGKVNDLLRVAAKDVQREFFESIGVEYADLDKALGGTLKWVNKRNVLVHRGQGEEFLEMAKAYEVVYWLTHRVILRSLGFEVNEEAFHVDGEFKQGIEGVVSNLWDDPCPDVMPLGDEEA